VHAPKTEVRILRQTTLIERPEVERGWVRNETRDGMQPHRSRMPKLKCESYCIQREVQEGHQGDHNDATEQESAA